MRTGPNIYKRTDGRWEARIIIGRKPDGRPQYKYLYRSSYRHALIAKKEYEQMLPCHSINKPFSNVSFLEASRSWLSDSEAKWKPSTYNKYTNCLDKHLLPEWGSLSLTDINQERYDALLKKLENELSVSSIRTVNTVIFGCLKHELNNIPILGSNPPEPMKTPVVTLSDAESSQLIASLKRPSDLCAVGILLTLYSGIRLGELCALKWENLDPEQKVFYVRHTLQRIQVSNNSGDSPRTELQLMLPKNRRERVIPIHPDILDLLQELHKIYPPSAYLLSGSDSPVEPRTMTNRFKRRLKDAGIRDIHFHTLRHTFATRCVESGMNIQVLSEILGHSSVKITMDRYVHLSMNYKKLQIKILHFPDINKDFLSRQISRQEAAST